jgi:hypothetical protein
MEKIPPAGSTGNKQKYLKYAFGEIILVIIGILFALSINNWNENRKTRERLKVNLQELKTALLGDNERLKEFVVKMKEANEYGQYLQDFANDELEEIDTVKLRKALFYTGLLLTFEKNKTAFQNISSSGNMKYILAVKLKQDLAMFYSAKGWTQTYHDEVIMESYYSYLDYIHKFTKPGTLKSFHEAYRNQENQVYFEKRSSID